LRHDRAPVARAELPGTVASTAQRKQSEVADGQRGPQARMARAAIDGENAVIRWREQQDRPLPPTAHSRFSWQAKRAGPSGPKTSGVKAEWPRFGTRRGAQPANPTAARRDARIDAWPTRAAQLASGPAREGRKRRRREPLWAWRFEVPKLKCNYRTAVQNQSDV